MDRALAVLAATVVSFIAVSSLLLLLSLLCRSLRAPPKLPNSTSPLRTLPLSFIIEQPTEDECKSFDPSLPPLTFSLLSAATRNFHPDHVVGDGSFGLVYRALLPDGTPVAVKSLSPDAFNGIREFLAEISTLGRLRHPHLARFIGYCISGPHRLLVYQYFPHGSLDHWLHELPPPSPLTFPVRLRILRGVASGLAFLHDGCSPSVIHRDIKSSNVLLDDDFQARIADFGLAREIDISRTHVSTQVAGTMGYMSPEYIEGATVATVKGDVYSFGILMLEVVTGKRPNLAVALVEDGGKKRDVGLVWWARRMVEEGREAEMAEPGMDGLDVSVLKTVVAVAIMCTNDGPRQRPAIAEVVDLLDRVEVM